jgi:hypothetical protein
MKTALLSFATLVAAFFWLVPPSTLAALRASPGTARSPIVTSSLERAQFTSAIKDREPADSLTQARVDKTQLYFFTELKGGSGTSVTHRWEHDGKVEHEQTFQVNVDRWRGWTSKSMSARSAGEWKVSVVDASGATLGTYTLVYGK